MEAFQNELMRRSPLAACVLEVSDYIFEDQLLESIWEQHRGRCYQDVLRFDDFVRLMRDALIHHGGSAHRQLRQIFGHGSFRSGTGSSMTCHDASSGRTCGGRVPGAAEADPNALRG